MPLQWRNQIWQSLEEGAPVPGQGLHDEWSCSLQFLVRVFMTIGPVLYSSWPWFAWRIELFSPVPGQGLHDKWTCSLQFLDRVCMTSCKLQALVYDILPWTTAVFSYVIGCWKCQLTSSFSLVLRPQTTQIKQDVSFIAANKVYTSTNKTTIVWIETEHFSFFTWVWMRLMFTWVLGD